MEEINLPLSKDDFRDLFISYYDNLCRFSGHIVIDKTIAEEVVQVVFMHLWEKRNKLIIKKSIKSYLFRAVYNQSLNHLKRLDIEKKYIQILKFIPPDEDQSYMADLETRELEIFLSKKIEQLPDGIREVFIMSRFDGFKNIEIAEKLNIAVKTVEGRMTRALLYLRESLSDISSD